MKKIQIKLNSLSRKMGFITIILLVFENLDKSIATTLGVMAGTLVWFSLDAIAHVFATHYRKAHERPNPWQKEAVVYIQVDLGLFLTAFYLMISQLAGYILVTDVITLLSSDIKDIDVHSFGGFNRIAPILQTKVPIILAGTGLVLHNVIDNIASHIMQKESPPI